MQSRLAKKASCIFVAGALAAMLAAGGCRLGGPGSDPQNCVRVINAVPDAQIIRVTAQGQQILSQCSYRQSTYYQGVPAGHYKVYAEAQTTRGQNIHLPVADADILAHHSYTALALGQAIGHHPTAHLELFDDQDIAQNPIPKDKAQVRVVCAAPDTSAVDLLVNSIVAFKDLHFGARSEPVMLTPLRYDWSVKEAGGFVTPLVGPVAIKLEGGHSYLIVVMGRTSDQTLDIRAFEDK